MSTAINFDAQQFLDKKTLLKTANELITSERWKRNTSFIRAVGRAIKMLQSAPFWSFDGKSLRIVSESSGKEYRGITAEQCFCLSQVKNRGFCKHRSAAVLLENLKIGGEGQ